MKIGAIASTVISGSLDEANKELTFRDDNFEYIVVDYTNDKNLTRTANSHYLTYRGMS